MFQREVSANCVAVVKTPPSKRSRHGRAVGNEADRVSVICREPAEDARMSRVATPDDDGDVGTKPTEADRGCVATAVNGMAGNSRRRDDRAVPHTMGFS